MQSVTEWSLPGKKAEIRVFKPDERLPFIWDKKLDNARITGDITRVRGTPEHRWNDQEAVEKTITIRKDGGKTLAASMDQCRKEVKLMFAARHTHAMHVIAAYFSQPSSGPLNFHIVMEYADGGDLYKYLSETPDDLQERWIGCLICVVAHIHRRGIRHRDIKPQNILVKGNEVLLTDFGISHMSLGKTVPTTMPGWNKSRTTSHCAPEVNLAEGRSRGRSADIFSLGAVILEMLLSHSYNKDYRDLITMTEYEAQGSGQRAQSFAEGLDEVHKILDDFEPGGKRRVRAPSHTSIMSLCQDMLKKERDERPTADNIELRWGTLSKAADGARGTASAAQLTCARCTATHVPGKTKTDELLEACKAGKAAQVRALLAADAPDRPNPNTEGAIHQTAVSGDEDTLRVLIEGGADVNTLDFAGQTALHYAAANGHMHIASFLLGRPGIRVAVADLEGETPLHCAAAHGCVDVIGLLLNALEKVSDAVNALDYDELTPLHYAARRGHLSAVKLLLANGADKKAKARQSGATPAKFARDRGFPKVEKTLNDWDPNDWDRNKRGK